MKEEKVTPEQLKTLNNIQTRFTTLIKYNGELRYRKRILEKEIDAADAELDKLDLERLAMSAEIEKIFGKSVSVDLVTGQIKKTND